MEEPVTILLMSEARNKTESATSFIYIILVFHSS
jgi:hypothetical protein